MSPMWASSLPLFPPRLPRLSQAEEAAEKEELDVSSGDKAYLSRLESFVFLCGEMLRHSSHFLIRFRPQKTILRLLSFFRIWASHIERCP